jgi:hypothetical protein
MFGGLVMYTKNILPIVAVIILFPLMFPAYGAEKSSLPPKIIDTSPDNGSGNVDPTLTEISVTFDQPMMDKSWSWAYEDKDKFPEMIGDPYYTEDYTKCVLPVKLEPNKEYLIWINTAKFKNFKSKTGIPAEPFKLTFKTK